MKSRNARSEFKMRERRLQHQIQKAEKAEDAQKVEELKMELSAAIENEKNRRAAAVAAAAQYSHGTFMGNYTEVFGSPPRALRKHVEAILEWFDPAPAKKQERKRSA